MHVCLSVQREESIATFLITLVDFETSVRLRWQKDSNEPQRASNEPSKTKQSRRRCWAREEGDRIKCKIVQRQSRSVISRGYEEVVEEGKGRIVHFWSVDNSSTVKSESENLFRVPSRDPSPRDTRLYLHVHDCVPS